MTLPGNTIWREDCGVVVFDCRRIELLSKSANEQEENKLEYMAPVSNPDKDLESPTGGESLNGVAFSRIIIKVCKETSANM